MVSDRVVLRAKDIYKSYQARTERIDVLLGVDLEVRKGEIVAVTGPSGVGKSTLLHILGALDRPSRGQLWLDSTEVFNMNDDQVAKFRNMAPEELRRLLEAEQVPSEEAAEVVRAGGFTKPLVAYVAGLGLQPGVRYSHASAIVARGRGSAESKIRALKEAGAIVVERLQDIAPTVERLLKEA